MKLLYHMLLFLFFFGVLLISMSLDSSKKLWIIVLTAIVLYGLSELSSYLKNKWFSTLPTMVTSQDATRGLRLSASGQIQTAILRPTVQVVTTRLVDARNHPDFSSQEFPFLYRIDLEFDVINGITNKRPLLMREATVEFDLNCKRTAVSSKLPYSETIQLSSSKRITTAPDKPLFLGYTEEIRKCALRVVCSFDNHANLTSVTTEIVIERTDVS